MQIYDSCHVEPAHGYRHIDFAAYRRWYRPRKFGSLYVYVTERSTIFPNNTDSRVISNRHVDLVYSFRAHFFFTSVFFFKTAVIFPRARRAVHITSAREFDNAKLPTRNLQFH